MELGEVAMMDLIDRDRARCAPCTPSPSRGWLRLTWQEPSSRQCGGHHRWTNGCENTGIRGVRSSNLGQARRKKIAPAMRRFAQRGHPSQCRLPFVSSDNLILSRWPRKVKHRHENILPFPALTMPCRANESIDSPARPPRSKRYEEVHMSRERLYDRYRELQSYVGWTPEDAQLVAAIAPRLEPHLPPLVDDFYAEIDRHAATRQVLTGGQKQIDRLKRSLAAVDP